VVPNIRDNGVAIQWSADVTERAHVTEIKNPTSSTNNQNYESQICHHLDQAEKCQRFDLATAVHEVSIDFWTIDDGTGMVGEIGESDDDDDDNDFDLESPNAIATTAALLSAIVPTKPLSGTTRTTGNYFACALALQQGLYPSAPLPFRTFMGAETTLHLNRNPSYRRMSVDQVAELFKIPDLQSALSNYLTNICGHHISLPFNVVEVWSKVKIQNHTYDAPHDILPAQTVNALPSSKTWPSGRADAVFINVDPDCMWPLSGMKGIVATSFILFISVHFFGFRPSSWAITTNFSRYSSKRNFASPQNQKFLVICTTI
jgi:hypothetical protein